MESARFGRFTVLTPLLDNVPAKYLLGLVSSRLDGKWVLFTNEIDLAPKRVRVWGTKNFGTSCKPLLIMIFNIGNILTIASL